MPSPYVGRIAPTPTGYLHRGHGRTFGVAWQRARAANGHLVYREEDLDPQRCRPEFAAAATEDLRWLGLDWDSGPDLGGPSPPYRQSARTEFYREAANKLLAGGFIYPTTRSRRELREAAEAGLAKLAPADPDEQDGEPIFPPAWRPTRHAPSPFTGADDATWRFRVPDNETLAFVDGHFGLQSFVAGIDFGDFPVWRRDGIPAYELAVVVDDIAMGITEVVRGADLLRSTARQLLIYRALGAPPPAFFHCPLVRDDHGQRLAKRSTSESLRALRECGIDPATLRAAAPPS